ncbi:MAG: CPBP family intramembrane metalloprotease [Anaerolineales bacterium]|jgi:membrane protease YdiL (CAAX protease family)
MLGNLLSIPLLRAEGNPVEPVSLWILWTAASIILIGVGLLLASRVGLGLPLVDRYLQEGDAVSKWMRSVLSISALVAIGGSFIFLYFNLGVDPEKYPDLWKFLLGSIDAGVQEEIFVRLILVSLFAWLGSLLWRKDDGRPTSKVMWVAILLSAVLFGWSHIDDGELLSLTISLIDVLAFMVLTSLFGVILGWMYWRLGHLKAPSSLIFYWMRWKRL